MFKKILVPTILVVAVFTVFVSLRPAYFAVSRSATMAAPPAAVFTQVNDFHKWEAWSPWAKKDPAAKTSYAGPAEGAGASFHWAGNKEVGEGTMTITDSRPGESIKIRLDFLKPFKGTSDATFTFKPEGANTVVTWNMSGKNNFIAKAMGLFIDCDKMIGGEFEKGLASMKTIVESAPQ